jgi:hypothetical protein
MICNVMVSKTITNLYEAATFVKFQTRSDAASEDGLFPECDDEEKELN